ATIENDPFGYWKGSQEPAKEGKKKEELASAEATAGKEKTEEEKLTKEAKEIKSGKAAKKEVKIKDNEAALNIVEFSDFSETPFKQGDIIKVKRTSGKIEDDWQIGSIDKKEGLIKVFKLEIKDGDKKGEFISKWIPVAELIALNPTNTEKEKKSSASFHLRLAIMLQT
ncbi:MAG: hypothetical protein UU24_C0017G0001, partial [Candidatus Nomurabacteria bacterium GW2011_GWA2_40_9]